MAYDAAAKKGLSILLQKGATTVGGFKVRSISISSDLVDVTTADDTSRWRQALAGAAVKNLSFSGSGVVKDTAAQQAMVTDVIAQTLDTYTVTIPGLGTFAGLYQITQFQASGDHTAEVAFDITLESAGDITFTAET